MRENYFLAILFFIALYWVFNLYEPFLLIITIASLLAIATSDINSYFYRISKNKLASVALSTTVLSILLFAPIIYFLSVILPFANKIDTSLFNDLIPYLYKGVDDLPRSLDSIKAPLKDFLFDLDLSAMAKELLTFSASIGKGSANFLKDTAMIVIFFFFVQYYGHDIAKYFKKLIPLNEWKSLILVSEISNVMSVVFYSIIVTAIFEGALFGFIANFYGYDGLLFGILYGFASLIPIVGGMLMWLPLSSYEFLTGDAGNAVVIMVYSIVVISIIADTFIKPIIIKYINLKFIKSKKPINELLIFFSIIAGLGSFGFWGMILGPAITTFFLSVLKIYEEFKLRNSAVQADDITYLSAKSS